MTERWKDGERRGAGGRSSYGARREAAAFAGSHGTGGLVAESAGLYQLLVESVQDYAIFALDISGHILNWNAGARRIKGYTRDEVVGRHFSIFYPADDLAAHRPERELETAARNGRVEVEGWRVRKDGTRFWANVVITALRDDMGLLVGFAKVTRDLTDRRRAEEILRDSEERFRLLVQSVRDYGIFMLDPEGRIASWNEGAQRLKGYTAGEIIGRHFSTFYPPEDVAAGKPAWELEVAVAEGRVEDEGWRVRKDGTRFWANVVITALRNDKGVLVGFTKVTRDLTERREAEIRALEATRRAAESEASSRAKSEFLAAMSHELRTPLNAIGGYTELLVMGLRGPVTEAQRTDLEKIGRSQRHLLNIINDLLNFSRIEAGQMEYEREPVPLSETVAAVALMLEPQAAAKKVAFVTGPCPESLVALADRVKVEQIVLNLCSNAVKFTGAGGRVEVTCQGTDSRVVVEVRDTGEGIPEEDLDRIFEPFVQLGRGLTTAHEGTGLGLAISRDLARAMDGDLSVRSTVGEGSTFTLALPAFEAPAG